MYSLRDYIDLSARTRLEIPLDDKLKELKKQVGFNNILTLNKNDAKDFINNLHQFSDDPNYSVDQFKVIGTLKNELDVRGLEVNNLKPSFNGKELNAYIQSGSTYGQIVLATPDDTEGRLGSMKIRDKFISRADRKEQLNKSVRTRVSQILEPVVFMFGMSTKDTEISRVANSKNLIVRTSGSSGTDGVFYMNQVNTQNYEKSITQRYLEDEFQSKSMMDLVRDAYERYYEDMELNEDLQAFPEKRVLPFDEIEPQLLDENGELDLRRVDMNVLTRYSDSSQNIVQISNALREEQLKFVSEGKGSTEDFNRMMMQDLSGIIVVHQQEFDNTDPSDLPSGISFERYVSRMKDRYSLDDKNAPLVFQRLASKVDMSSDILPSELNEQIVLQEEVEDEEASKELALDGVGELMEDSIDFIDEGNIGSRQRFTNFLVGSVDENGVPLAGILPEDQETEMMKRLKKVAEESALSAGITQFEAVYDNDHVLHWQGVQQITNSINKEDGTKIVEERIIRHKIGQIFTPEEKDVFDENGNLVAKAGVIQTKFGSQVNKLCVASYKGDFVPPTYDKDGNVDNFRHSLMTRLKLTGIEQALSQEISSTVKSQAFFRMDESYERSPFLEADNVYDSTRLRNVYKDTTPITFESMVRPGVVEQMTNTVRFDAKWLGLDYLLKAEMYGEETEPQYIRNVLHGLEGVFDESASSDGKVLGLKRVLTTEFSEFLNKNIDDPNFKFSRNGTLGTDGIVKSTGEETILQRDFLNIPIEERKTFKSPLADILDSNFGDHDSPDRSLMAMNMITVADDVIGGEFDTSDRGKVKLALMTVGGLTYEDSIVVSKEAAEKYGWRIGDKLADTHSNKGVISYIAGLDENDPHYNADAEDVFKNNPDLEMIQSPYGPATRANAGLVKELQNSEHIQEVVDGQGRVRGFMGDLSVITTNMRAAKKVKAYGLEDTPKSRHLSYQQYYVLQAHGAEGLLSEVFNNNEKAHEDLAHYFNAIGVSIDDDGVISAGHIGMDIVEESIVNPNNPEQVITRYVEQPNDDLFIVQPEDASIKLPEGSSYLELPCEVSVSANEELSRFSPSENGVITTSYFPILPSSLRKSTETFDGNYVESDYSIKIKAVIDSAQALKSAKISQLSEDENAFGEGKAYLSFNEFLEALDNGDESAKNFLKQTPSMSNEAKRLENNLNINLKAYENVIITDQFGRDFKSIKHSYVRRNIVAKGLPDSATSIITNDTSLPLDTVAISPVLAVNLGFAKPIDEASFERAKSTGSVDKMNEALKGNWEFIDGREDQRVMLWRDPTLHDGSVAGFKIKVNEELIGTSINPFIISPMAMDFDGDQVGLFRPRTKEGQLSLENELNITNNLIDGRGQPIFSVGMDLVDNVANSDWGQYMFAQAYAKAQEESQDFTNYNYKKLINDYIDQSFERYDNEYQSALVDALSEEGVNRLNNYESVIASGSSLSDADMADYSQLSKVRSEKLNERNQAFQNEMQQFSNQFFKNEAGSTSRFLDYRSDEEAIDSIKDMIVTGAKGNADSLARFNEYLTEGVKYEDREAVRKALAAKNDLTGLAGAASLRMAALMKYSAFDTVNGLEDGARVALDIAESNTQPVLDIKRSPDEVPVVENYLSNFRKFVSGPDDKKFEKFLTGEGPVPKVYVTIHPEEYSSILDELRKNDPSSLTEEKDRAAFSLDSFNDLVKNYNNQLGVDENSPYYMKMNIDINNGIIKALPNDIEFVKNNPIPMNRRPERIEALEMNPYEAYNLAFVATFKEANLSVPPQSEINLVQNAVRDKDLGLLSYDYNLTHNASPIDTMAQRGYNGLVDIVRSNNNALYLNKDREPEFKFGGGKWDQIVAGDYEQLNHKIENQYSKSKESYESVLTSIKEQRELLSQKSEEELKLDLEPPKKELQWIDFMSPVGEVVKDSSESQKLSPQDIIEMQKKKALDDLEVKLEKSEKEAEKTHITNEQPKVYQGNYTSKVVYKEVSTDMDRISIKDLENDIYKQLDKNIKYSQALGVHLDSYNEAGCDITEFSNRYKKLSDNVQKDVSELMKNIENKDPEALSKGVKLGDLKELDDRFKNVKTPSAAGYVFGQESNKILSKEISALNSELYNNVAKDIMPNVKDFNNNQSEPNKMLGEFISGAEMSNFQRDMISKYKNRENFETVWANVVEDRIEDNLGVKPLIIESSNVINSELDSVNKECTKMFANRSFVGVAEVVQRLNIEADQPIKTVEDLLAATELKYEKILEPYENKMQQVYMGEDLLKIDEYNSKAAENGVSKIPSYIEFNDMRAEHYNVPSPNERLYAKNTNKLFEFDELNVNQNKDLNVKENLKPDPELISYEQAKQIFDNHVTPHIQKSQMIKEWSDDANQKLNNKSLSSTPYIDKYDNTTKTFAQRGDHFHDKAFPDKNTLISVKDLASQFKNYDDSIPMNTIEDYENFSSKTYSNILNNLYDNVNNVYNHQDKNIIESYNKSAESSSLILDINDYIDKHSNENYKSKDLSDPVKSEEVTVKTPEPSQSEKEPAKSEEVTVKAPESSQSEKEPAKSEEVTVKAPESNQSEKESVKSEKDTVKTPESNQSEKEVSKLEGVNSPKDIELMKEVLTKNLEEAKLKKEKAKAEKEAAKAEKEAYKAEKEAYTNERLTAKENGASKDELKNIRAKELEAAERQKQALQREKEAREREKEALAIEKEAKNINKELKKLQDNIDKSSSNTTAKDKRKGRSKKVKSQNVESNIDDKNNNLKNSKLKEDLAKEAATSIKNGASVTKSSVSSKVSSKTKDAALEMI